MIWKVYLLFFLVMDAFVHGEPAFSKKKTEKEPPRQITLSQPQAFQHLIGEEKLRQKVKETYNTHSFAITEKSKYNPIRFYNKHMKAKLQPKVAIHEKNVNQLSSIQDNGGTIELGRSASGKRYEYGNARPFPTTTTQKPDH